MAWDTILQLTRGGAHKAPSLPLRLSFRGIATTGQMLRRGNQEQAPTVKTRLGINKLTESVGVEEDLIHIMEVNGSLRTWHNQELGIIQVTLSVP